MAVKHLAHITEMEDRSTGEYLRTQKDFVIRTESEPNFIKLYLGDIGKISGLQPNTMLLLLEFLKIMDYDNLVHVGYGRKIDMYKAIHGEATNRQITVYMHRHIGYLVKAGLLYEKVLGQYIVNPNIFGKGKWADVKKIVLQVTYSESGAMIMTDVKKSKLSR